MERAVPVLPADDINAARTFYEEWRQRVKVDGAPKNEEWGGRTFGVTDPAGNTIFVIGPIA